MRVVEWEGRSRVGGLIIDRDGRSLVFPVKVKIRSFDDQTVEERTA